MALDSSVLASIGDRGTLPAAEAPMKAMQLADLVNRQQLSKIQLQEEQEEQQTYGKLKGLIDTEKLDMSKPDDQNRLVAEASRLSPKLGMKLQREMTANQAGQAQLTQALIDLTKERMTILSDAATPFADTARKLAMGDPAHGIAPLSDQEIDAKLLPQMTQVMKKLKDVKLANGEALLSPELQQEAAQLLSGNVRKGLETFVMQHQEAMTKLDDIDKRRRTAAKEEGENRETKVVMKDGKPHQVLYEKSTGNEVKDLGEAPPTATTASAAESSTPAGVRALQIQESFALTGVPLPAGVTPYGKEKQKFWMGLATDPRYKDKSPQEIAEMGRSGKLGMVASTKETQQASGRVAQIAGASASIFQDGGIADQLFDAAKATGLPNNKLQTQGRDVLSKLYSNPAWAKYKEVHGELVAEMGVVISKANPTVNGQQEAAAMFPLVSSQEEVKSQLDAAKLVASAIESGNQSVVDAIVNHKPLSEIMKATKSPVPPSDGAITKWEMKDGKLVKVTK